MRHHRMIMGYIVGSEFKEPVRRNSNVGDPKDERLT